MTGLRRTLLLAIAAFHRWRAERDLDAGAEHKRKADEAERRAEELLWRAPR